MSESQDNNEGDSLQNSLLNNFKSPNSPNNSSSDNENERFTCNICFDVPTDPVITQCGHLFCWNCLCDVCLVNIFIYRCIYIYLFFVFC